MQVSFKNLYKIPLKDFSKLGRINRNKFCTKISNCLKQKYMTLDDEFASINVKSKKNKNFEKICKLFKLDFIKTD